MRENAYYLNIKERKDMGVHYANMAWIHHKYESIGNRTHAERFREAYLGNIKTIDKVCDGLCGECNCNGIEKCLLTLPIIHNLLKD